MFLRPEQGDHGFAVGDFTASHCLHGLIQRQGEHFQAFVVVAVVITGLQAGGEVDMDDFVGVADAGVQRGKVAPFTGGVAGFFQQFALAGDQRGFIGGDLSRRRVP